MHPDGAPAGRFARAAAPPELEFEEKGKTGEAGRMWQRICKGLDEVVLHAGSPFGDGGYPVRCARKAATVPTSIFEALL